jgi:FAD:protein FMN transferase
MNCTLSFQALGTKWHIEIFDAMSTQTEDAVRDSILGFCKTYNDTYSRFHQHSLISKINTERILNRPSQECLTLITLGQTLYHRTDGALNMLVGHILEARGYDQHYSFIPATNDSAMLTTCNPDTDLTITPERITLSCGKVDLGGYGKGYAIDRIASILVEHGINYFLINGGGDMYGTTKHGVPITIYLEHPLNAGISIFETTLANQGFAASSPFKRQWKHGDMTYHHIVGGEDTELFGVFTKAHCALDADAFTKSALFFTDTHLIELGLRENVAFARFNHNTNELWRTSTFD